MKLEKINEAYTVTDELENGWRTNGQAIKEKNGSLRINFTVTNEVNHIGNYNYDINMQKNLHINMSCAIENEEEFDNYSTSLVDQILAELESTELEK